jgi:hypothetical protein
MQMMDLTPFFHNVERIATALETIARNGTPNTYEGESRPLLSVEAKDRILATLRGDEPKKVDTAGTEGRTRPRAWLDETKKEEIERRAGFSVLPNPLVVAGVTQGQANAANTQILGFIKRVHDEGAHTANGIANSLKARGIPHPRGLKWHNLSVKPFMDQLGLASPYGVRGGRKPKDAAVSATQQAEPAPEPDPAPAGAEPTPEAPPAPVERRINRAFVQREFKRHREHDAHLNLRGMLSPETQAKLDAHEKADREQRSLIEAAVAAGKVTKLPACVDSNGVNHLEESGHGMMRGSGGSFGPNTGSRVQARGSNT